jgi:alkylation response protein AidB-like acyl-CoA dehydrogenase
LYRAVDRRDDPALRTLAVEAWSQLTLAALVARRVQAARLSGQAPGPEGSGGKLRAVNAYRAVAAFAAQALGPAVLFEGEEWVTTIMTVPSMSIRGGTDEIQRNIIAERVLGLPRDNAPDPDARR